MNYGPYDRSFKAKPGSSNANQIRYDGVYIGFVKDNTDIQKMGRLRVYIPLLGGDANNPQYWHTVSYCSPFAGASPVDQTVVNGKTMAQSQTSYGFWMIPPDRNNEVIVMFINGDPVRGIWMGCLYQQNMNHMVPGVAFDNSFQNTDVCVGLPPVVEYNKQDQAINVDNPIRPMFSPLNTAFANQGLQSDLQRGPTNASARRDAPSQVFGFISPRSHNIYIDDGLIDTTVIPNTGGGNGPAYSYTQDTNADEYIRMRTRNGTQILINDTTGFVYINSRSGNSWAEISDQGVDIFSQERVSVRAMQDVNVHADQNINMYSGGDIKMFAVGNIRMQSGADISANSGGGLYATSTTDTNIVAGGNMNLQATSDVNIKGNQVTTSELFAPNVHVNNCFANTSFGAVMTPNGSPQSPGSAVTAPTIPQTTFIDRTLVPPCYPPVANKTITTRTPTHEPWVNHPSGPANTNAAGSGTNFAVGVPGYPNVEIQPNPSGNNSGQLPTGPGQTPLTAVPPTEQVITGDGRRKTVMNNPNTTTDTSCGTPISDNVRQSITNASSQAQMDPGLMFAIAQTESSFDPNAQSTTSSAAGLYQFTSGTWSGMVSKYGAQTNISQGDIYDPQSNATMGALYAKSNQQALQSSLGPDTTVTNTDIYIAHFLGPTGASKFLSADPNANAASVVGPGVANANANIFYVNGDRSQPRTVQQVYNIFDQKVGAQVAKYNNCYGSDSTVPT
jgi:Transglycosylase SLT domain/Type VI secretion system/phage-baseplate injector OB domain/Hemagglutinin repeat